MADEALLQLEPPAEADGQITLAASLDDPAGQRHHLWYRVPTEWRHTLTDAADPFVLGFLFPMMQWGRPVRVAGIASPSLLANLERLMGVWKSWQPQRYRAVSIRADQESEPPPVSRPGEAITPISGGVDSCFTLWRHARGMVGRRTRRIGLAMSMYGFDIRLDQARTKMLYSEILKDCRTLTDDLKIPLVSVTTNFHDLPTYWGHAFGTHLVSGLMLFQGQFDHALMANDIPYTRLHPDWGSHPMNNPFLGGDRFRVEDDGGEFGRFEKIKIISQWPAAMKHLRVCYENRQSHRNCCECEKCLRTMLSFRVAGVPQPEAFDKQLTPRDIRRAHFHRLNHNMAHWNEILRAARTNGMYHEPWARAMRAAKRRNRVGHLLKRIKTPLLPLRNRIRQLFRGTSLSRRQVERIKELEAE